MPTPLQNMSRGRFLVWEAVQKLTKPFNISPFAYASGNDPSSFAKERYCLVGWHPGASVSVNFKLTEMMLGQMARENPKQDDGARRMRLNRGWERD